MSLIRLATWDCPCGQSHLRMRQSFLNRWIKLLIWHGKQKCFVMRQRMFTKRWHPFDSAAQEPLQSLPFTGSLSTEAQLQVLKENVNMILSINMILHNSRVQSLYIKFMGRTARTHCLAMPHILLSQWLCPLTFMHSAQSPNILPPCFTWFVSPRDFTKQTKTYGTCWENSKDFPALFKGTKRRKEPGDQDWKECLHSDSHIFWPPALSPFSFFQAGSLEDAGITEYSESAFSMYKGPTLRKKRRGSSFGLRLKGGVRHLFTIHPHPMASRAITIMIPWAGHNSIQWVLNTQQNVVCVRTCAMVRDSVWPPFLPYEIGMHHQ